MGKHLQRRVLAALLAVGGIAGGLSFLGASQAGAADVSANLSITKAGPFHVGASWPNWQITVTNIGPQAATSWTASDVMNGPVEMDAPVNITTSDPRCAVVQSTVSLEGVPAIQKVLSCSGGPLAAGASTVINVHADTDGTNRACVHWTDAAGNSANNCTTAVPIDSIPMVNPALAAGAAAVTLAAGAGASLIRRRTTG